MKKKLGILISDRTDALATVLQKLPITDKLSREIAFQIAELSPEFEFILDLVKKAEKGQALTPAELEELYGDIRWHWPMHLRPLKKALLRAIEKIDSPAVQKHDPKRNDARTGSSKTKVSKKGPSQKGPGPR